jgi:phosphoglycolate phosphatase-like HAD superfamily hydrolase
MALLSPVILIVEDEFLLWLVRPFSAVPDLLRRVRDAGVQIAIASSAKKVELDKYLDIARITDRAAISRPTRSTRSASSRSGFAMRHSLLRTTK